MVFEGSRLESGTSEVFTDFIILIHAPFLIKVIDLKQFFLFKKVFLRFFCCSYLLDSLLNLELFI